MKCYHQRLHCLLRPNTYRVCPFTAYCVTEFETVFLVIIKITAKYVFHSNGASTPLRYRIRLSSSMLLNYFMKLLTEYLMQFDSDSE